MIFMILSIFIKNMSKKYYVPCVYIKKKKNDRPCFSLLRQTIFLGINHYTKFFCRNFVGKYFDLFSEKF